MSKLPFLQFYPADWLNDLKLQTCSPASKGTLIDLMCLMHQSKKYGYLIINGSIPDHKTIIKLLRTHHRTFKKALTELLYCGALKQDEDGCLYCNRMVEDHKKREAAKVYGSQGGSPKFKEFYDQPGYVYFIKRESDGLYKIGIAKNIENRMRKLRQKNKCEMELVHFIKADNMGYHEKKYHKQFSAKNVIGEWFRLTEKDIQTLKGAEKGRVTSKSGASYIRGQRSEVIDQSLKEHCQDAIKFLNEKTGKAFSPTAKGTQKLIKARLKDGYTLEQFYIVIANKTDKWLKNPEMVDYLRPETLFTANHFESYLNETGCRKLNDAERRTLQNAMACQEFVDGRN